MIDVIIPIFNRPEYTMACLYSLYYAQHGTPIRPIIVDNGSRGRTVSLISEWLAKHEQVQNPEVVRPIICRHPSNKGFAGGVNSWLKDEQCSDLVCILHNDTIVTDNWIGELSGSLKDTKEDEVAVWIPRTNYANEMSVCTPDVRKTFEAIKPPNKDRLDDKEILRVFLNTYSDGREQLTIENYQEMNFSEWNNALTHPWVQEFLTKLSKTEPRNSYTHEISCFCMLIKKEVFNEFGLFDEEFFPRGFEDKYWFLKMERQGLCVNIANRAYVHHFGNITSDGPGYCFPDIMKLNEDRYKKKVEELNKKNI